MQNSICSLGSHYKRGYFKGQQKETQKLITHKFFKKAHCIKDMKHRL